MTDESNLRILDLMGENEGSSQLMPRFKCVLLEFVGTIGIGHKGTLIFSQVLNLIKFLFVSFSVFKIDGIE